MEHLGWVTGYDDFSRYIPRNYGPCSDDGSFAYAKATEDRGPRADRNVVLDTSREELPVVGCLEQPGLVGCPRMLVVDKRHTMTDEDTVPDRHTLTDERVALDLARRPDARPGLNLNEGPDAGMRPYAASIEVRECLNDYALVQQDIMQLTVGRLILRRPGFGHASYPGTL